MKRLRFSVHISWIAFATFALGTTAIVSISFAAAPARLLTLNLADLNEANRRLDANEAALLPAFNRLKRDADRALSAGPFAVTDKDLTPPCPSW